MIRDQRLHAEFRKQRKTKFSLKHIFSETRILYEQLSSLVNSIRQRDEIVIGDDFTAKTNFHVTIHIKTKLYSVKKVIILKYLA